MSVLGLRGRSVFLLEQPTARGMVPVALRRRLAASTCLITTDPPFRFGISISMHVHALERAARACGNRRGGAALPISSIRPDGSRDHAKEEIIMRYRVYSGPRGSESVSPLEKDRWLFKEYAALDDALGWAQHVNDHGGVALLIEGDDGTILNKREIAAALSSGERQPSRA